MQGLKKIVLALACLLMIISIPLSAAEMTVRWAWTHDDPAVTAYRYQIDGEDPDGWTVVGSDVTSIEIAGLDAEAEHTLHLQRSYDGENWSASATSTAKADLSKQPAVRIYRYGGYELKATVGAGETTIEYPAAASKADVEAFIAYENSLRGLGDLGIVYTLGDGEAEFAYPEQYTKDIVIPQLDALVEDLVAYITAPAPAAESAAEAPAAAAPIVRTYSFGGYSLTATIQKGSATIEYPAIASDDEVKGFIALENAKYGLGGLGVVYSIDGPGKASFSYPEAYAPEDVAKEVDLLVEDLIAYITTPAAEMEPEAPVDEPIVKSYEHLGYTLTATIGTGETTIEYPSFITNEEVGAFFAVENAKYGLGELGVSYAFGEAGSVEFTYPEEYSKETVAEELDLLVADLIAYITPPAAPEPEEVEIAEEPAPEPVEESAPIAPIAPVEPVALSEDELGFAFSLLVKGGVASSFDDTFTFDGRIFAEAGVGLDFANILPIGNHFGFGLRSDLAVNFIPKATGKWDMADKLQYFNLFNYAEMTSLDLKLMMDITAGPMELYLGGGAGFAIGNPHDNDAVSAYLALGTFDAGSVRFAMDWFASALAGVRFHIGDVFSIGAEVSYRYMVESAKHIGTADLVLGFTF